MTTAAASPPPAGLPTKPFVALSLALFSNAISIQIIFPIIGFQMMDLGLASSEQDAGWLAGYVAAAFMAGRVLTSISWGYIADKVGRKPVVLCGIASVIVFSFLYGLSLSFAWLVVVRFLAGASNALIPTSKTMVSEMCGPALQSKALALVGTTWGTGLIVGPAIGGILAHPADKYAVFQDCAFLRDFPYLLPCALCSLLSVLALLLCQLWLPETSEHTVPAARLCRSCGVFCARKVPCFHRRGVAYAVVGPAEGGGSDLPTLAPVQPPFYRQPLVMRAVSLYTLLSFVDIAFNEVYSLWCLAPSRLGGLGLGSSEIGISLGGVGVALLVFQLCVFPRIERRFGCRTAFSGSALVQVPAYLLLPMTSMTSGSVSGMWSMLLVVMLLKNIAAITCFTASFMIINNSSVREQRATVNGLAMSIASVGKALGPIAGSTAFAWSVRGSEDGGPAHTFPFNAYFVYIVGSILLVALVFMVRALPESINRPLEPAITEKEAERHEDGLVNDLITPEQA